MTEQKEHMKWAFIINPVAGNGKPKQMIDDLQKQIDSLEDKIKELI